MKAKSLILAGLMASSTMANAIVVTVQDNIADNTYISTPNSIVGQFDINAALPNDGSYLNPYEINSATANYSFADDGDLGLTNTVYNSYTRSGSSSYYRNKIDYYFDDNEQVQVTTSFEESTNGSDWSQTSSYTGTQYDGRSGGCGWFSCNYNYYYTRNYDESTGYTGLFEIEQIFDADSINDLAADGIVDFTVTATTGDLIFGSGSLTVDISENPVAVTEPASLAFFGLGLVSLGYLRRRLSA
ncbi:hypothetical protein A9Q99_18360 [Gammaproteobacteria bacterium 45_16_T64]|nr:hypothetical protein A9Q99_18360 [Gammaproteobacteria bacterium 45_16_T64]